MNVYPNWELRHRTDEVDWDDKLPDGSLPLYLFKIVETMKELADRYEEINPLAGLAANQVISTRPRQFGGSTVYDPYVPMYRIFILRQPDDTWKEYINPVITHRSDHTEWETEGCGSLPGVLVRVKRNYQITLGYSTLKTAENKINEDFDGPLSRVIQHELDHLDGILITDRNDPMNFLGPRT